MNETNDGSLRQVRALIFSLPLLGLFLAHDSVVHASPAQPDPINVRKMYPVIARTATIEPNVVRKPLVKGLDVFLAVERPSLNGQVRAQALTTADLATLSLSPTAAMTVAVANLKRVYDEGQIIIAGQVSQDGKGHVAMWWTNHWLASSCLLLPEVWETAASMWKGKRLVAVIPRYGNLYILPDGEPSTAARIAELTGKSSADGGAPITTQQLRLARPFTRPFYERSPF